MAETEEEAREKRIQKSAERVLAAVREINAGLRTLDKEHDTDTPYLDVAVCTLDGATVPLQLIWIEGARVDAVSAIRTMEQSKQERAEALEADDA